MEDPIMQTSPTRATVHFSSPYTRYPPQVVTFKDDDTVTSIISKVFKSLNVGSNPACYSLILAKSKGHINFLGDVRPDDELIIQEIV